MNVIHPTVSVVVTTFNRKNFLTETINSILNQSFDNFELIVVDNYSDYNFYKHIASFNDSRIRAYQNKNNGIIAVNRNYGIKISKGKYIAFCDDDDIWRTDKLAKQLSIIEKHPKIILCFGYSKKNGENTKFGQSNYGLLFRLMIKSKSDLLAKNTIALSTVLCRAEIFNNLSFDEHEKFIGIEDHVLWKSIINKGMFCLIQEILIDYRYHRYNASINNKYSEQDFNFKQYPFTLITNVLHLLLEMKLMFYAFCSKMGLIQARFRLLK